MIETLPVTGSVSIIFIIRQCKNQGKQFLNTLIFMLKFITFMLLQNEQVNFKFDFHEFFVIFQGKSENCGKISLECKHKVIFVCNLYGHLLQNERSLIVTICFCLWFYLNYNYYSSYFYLIFLIYLLFL